MLPATTEIPPLAKGYRDHAEFMRLTLLPADDAALRAKAVAMFRAREANFNAGAVDAETPEADRKELADIPARTPGGVAWKLSLILRFFENDPDWEWWRYLLESARNDAVDLERARATSAASGTDVAAFLAERWAELRRRHQAMPEIPDDPENTAARVALCEEWLAMSRTLAETPATSLAGVLGKLRVAYGNVEAGTMVDGHDIRLLDGIAADLARLSVGGAP